jgi:hypothetical protein
MMYLRNEFSHGLGRMRKFAFGIDNLLSNGVQPDPPVHVFNLASGGGRGPVNLVLLGRA